MIYDKETEKIEFKSSLSQLRKGIESLTAMINKHGSGEVLFGIEDDGFVCGIKDFTNKTIADISNAINENIKPTLLATIDIKKIKGKDVISVSAKGSKIPYSSYGNYLIRSGNENKKIEPEILKDLVFKGSSDTIVNIASLNQDLSFTQLKQLFIEKGLTINEDNFIKNNSFYTEDGTYNLLASILSDVNDISIKVVRFEGSDKSKLASRNEYGYKCLLMSMQQSLDYVLSLNETKVMLTGSSKREEVKLFDEKALREAWNNACVHNRWSSQIPPAIYIYDDRIEVISSGGLAFNFTEDEFFQGISHPINTQLQKIMGQLGYTEQTGHGVLEITKAYGKEAFKITSNNIVVTLNFRFIPYNKAVSNYNFLSPSQVRVLNAIKNSPTIKTRELVLVLGLQSTRISVIIKQLKDLGILKRIGSNKNGYWEILK